MQVEFENHVQSVLRNELLKRTKLDPRYSLRAFAKHLKCSPATLSGVLNGKRVLSPKMASAIAEHLSLDPVESQEFAAEPSMATSSEMHQINLDSFHAIADWYHWVIREMPRLKRKKLDAKSIAKEIGCTYIEAMDALERLKRLGLLTEREGKWVRTDAHITTGSDFPSSAMKRFHMQIQQRAKQSLLTDPIQQRDFSAITMAIDTKKLPEAKKRIQKFRRELCEFLETGTPDKIFTMAIQLFPQSRKGAD